MSGRSSTAGRAPATPRISADRPSGVTQRNGPAPPVVSATTRTSSAAPTATLPSSRATRLLAAAWLVSAPTPANTAAGDTVANARYADGPTASFVTTNPSQVANHRRAMPPRTPAS